ncbi:phage holin family protein [Deinococcus sp. HMF7620]|uniref:Phage holin family protein n=1 Tax=Deinococcus arboris TaxID=2682977 RepID=A0A7C9MBK6_9DEIO|nr:phage holin family protein [Deinococcus arboris]MVN89203.1 phage holin family protein [Deinococcus arboris]
MEERKSLGGALVDVFDAGVTLVKAELSALARKAGAVAKAKGLGAVLLLASTGPLVMGLIFIILAVFFGLMRLGLGPWAAALLIALVSFAVTGALIVLGLKKLGSEADLTEPRHRREDMNDDPTAARPTAPAPAAPSAASGSNAARDSHNSSGPKVELRRDAQEQAAGENRVLAEGQGQATVRVEHGTTTVPVYESTPEGEPQEYGSGLNKKIDGSETGKGHGHHRDPNLQEPVVLKDAPGIPVSTEPTYRSDMKRGES